MVKILRIAAFLFIFASSFYPQALQAGKKTYTYEVSLAAIFHDEAPYLKEWIEFHRIVGVEHFYLFNNFSQDNYQEVLQPYVDTGLVELIEWPYPNDNLPLWAKTQFSAYEKAVALAKGKSKWLVVIDTDEFLFPALKNTLQEVLKGLENFGAVAVNWQMYGTSNIDKIPSDEPISAYLLYRAPMFHHLNRNVKSIVRPEAVKTCSNPHFFNLHKGYIQVDPHGIRCSGQLNPLINNDVLRINHYWTRDLDYFYNKKLPRHSTWGENTNLAIQTMQELSAEYDDAILRFMPALQNAM